MRRRNPREIGCFLGQAAAKRVHTHDPGFVPGDVSTGGLFKVMNKKKPCLLKPYEHIYMNIPGCLYGGFGGMNTFFSVKLMRPRDKRNLVFRTGTWPPFGIVITECKIGHTNANLRKIMKEVSKVYFG